MTEDLAERIADTMFALATPSRVRILGCLRAERHAKRLASGRRRASQAYPGRQAGTA